MVTSMLPSRSLISALAGIGAVCTLLSFTAMAMAEVALLTGAIGMVLLALVGLDMFLTIGRWQLAPLSMQRHLPQAFAVGRRVIVRLTLDNPGASRRRGRLFELADRSMDMPSMPLRFDVGGGQRETLEFEMTPTERGLKRFEAGQILLHSSLGLLDWNLRIGISESRRVFPNFEHQAAFAWLAGERRLSEMGIKPVRRRGAGTDFDQLVEYRAGDPIRHIDWKATLTHHRPITRKFQDDRDQRVMFLLDCGRRMRADDTQHGIGATHFDQALNALMLLAFVALKFGDAVGAMTFGTPEGLTKRYAPRKGRQSINALMAELGDVEPTPTFSDYARSAADLIKRQRKRALVVLITNCRDEDAPELASALTLLRSRHLVVLANLREQIVSRIARQPLVTAESALEVAAALEYELQRGEMLRRFTVGGALTIDCEPQRLGVELVNRYTALKRAGSI
ncbi:MAG: hypothetical protein QOG17_246 [Gammaproteobacteria bacterium]|nr:hypothetical protein [Gammaproteobacteria bacterium]